MKLSVVIVNYNVKYYLEQCLCSLYRAVDALTTEVWVVDNASTDESADYIPSRFPHLTYLYNKENLGFACANNQAIRQAGGEYVLLLNPDTLLCEDTLEKLLAFMDEHPQAGAAGVKMLAADGHFLPESKRGYPTLSAAFGKLTGLGRFFRGLGGYYCSALCEEEIHKVDVLAGAFMLLRRSALEQSGLLDEDFFMYGEDIDLSCRMLAAGYENYYLPYSILHYKGESTVKDSYHHVRVFCGAMGVFFRKQDERYGKLTQALIQGAIHLQMVARLFLLYLRKKLASFHETLSPMAASEYNPSLPRFLVFGGEATIHSLRALFKRNGLCGKHHFVIANETSAAEGHGCSFFSLEGYTHVVYDSQAFSFSKIIGLLSRYRATGLCLGIYNPASRVLVTPQKCYI